MLLYGILESRNLLAGLHELYMQLVIFFGDLANFVADRTINLANTFCLVQVLNILLPSCSLLLEEPQELGNELGGFDRENGG